jgi:hypothetical protein
MDSKYGRSTLAKIELDVPKLHEIKDHLQEMADHFKAEAEQVDLMIVTLEKRVTVLREEDRLDNDRRQREPQEEGPSSARPFRRYTPTQSPTDPAAAGSTTKPTNPDTGTGAVSPTQPADPSSAEGGTAEAQPGTPEAQPVDPETSSGVDPTSEEESPRNKA